MYLTGYIFTCTYLADCISHKLSFKKSVKEEKIIIYSENFFVNIK